MRISDWSSDVCSSDLGLRAPALAPPPAKAGGGWEGVVTARAGPKDTPPQPSPAFAGEGAKLAAEAAPQDILRPRSFPMPPAQSTQAIPLRRLAFLLGGLAMFGPFSIDTIFPAFEHIGRELHADKVAMQQTISVYLIAYALMSVVHGPLSAAIGRRKVIIGGLAVLTHIGRAACRARVCQYM